VLRLKEKGRENPIRINGQKLLAQLLAVDKHGGQSKQASKSKEGAAKMTVQHADNKLHPATENEHAPNNLRARLLPVLGNHDPSDTARFSEDRSLCSTALVLWPYRGAGGGAWSPLGSLGVSDTAIPPRGVYSRVRWNICSHLADLTNHMAE